MAEEEEEARGCSTEEDESGQFIGSDLVLIRMPQPCSLALRDSKKMLGEWGVKRKAQSTPTRLTVGQAWKN